MHSTDNLNDGYIGSGKRLWFSINYHGKENHSKEILEFCNSRAELKKREEEIVNEQLLKEDLCMNLMTGGQGGFRDDEHREKFINSNGYKYFVERLNNDENFRKLHCLRVKNILKKGTLDVKNTRFKGNKHSDETKLLISQSSKGNGKGETNSQFGTCWITKNGENKKIKKEDLETYLNDGWIKGRK